MLIFNQIFAHPLLHLYIYENKCSQNVFRKMKTEVEIFRSDFVEECCEEACYTSIGFVVKSVQLKYQQKYFC